MKITNLWMFLGYKFFSLLPLFIPTYAFFYFTFASSSQSFFLQIFIIAFVISFIINFINIKYNHFFHKFSNDFDLTSAQKVHVNPVPRTGGVGLIMSLISIAYVLSYINAEVSSLLSWLLLAALPAFLGGIIEDLTKRVGVKTRFNLILLSVIISFLVLGSGLNRLDCVLIDWIFDYRIVSLLVTMFMASGVVNSFNIIDGFNGLSSLVAIIILSGFYYVSFLVNDPFIMHACLASIGAIFGFLIWNYPKGRIFLGDGGAYLIGFMIAEISLLLVARNPEVSAWFPFLLALYPIFETLFSIYRRKYIRGISPGQADGFHLHTLIYKRLIRVNGNSKIKNIIFLNSMTSPYLWVLCCLSVIPAILFWQNTRVLLICSFIFMLSYLGLYKRIINFNTPKMFLFFFKIQIAIHRFMRNPKEIV